MGLDASERLLALDGARYPDVRLERRDMRELAYRSEFDAVVNWFTSFGYFDSATNDALLASLARALRRGGRLLLDIHNPARLARILELTGGSTASVAERDGNLMVDRITYNAADQRSRTERFIVRHGRVRRLEFSLEQVPAPQLERRLVAAGFREVQLFGRDGGSFDPNGARLIAVARRQPGQTLRSAGEQDARGGAPELARDECPTAADEAACLPWVWSDRPPLAHHATSSVLAWRRVPSCH